MPNGKSSVSKEHVIGENQAPHVWHNTIIATINAIKFSARIT